MTKTQVTRPPEEAVTQGPAVLVLEDGTRYEGQAYGALGTTLGEIVFSTGMTGYQETLTDPSYADQIVLMTAPHIGNTGMNDSDMESRKIWVAGFVVRDPARRVSNYRAERSLDEDLVADGVVGISGIDTRAVTRRIRAAGAMRAGVFSGPDFELGDKEQLARVAGQESMEGKHLSERVTTPQRYEVAAATGVERIGTIAVIDLGIKRATVQYLSEHGFDVIVLPSTASVDEIRAAAPDALFYSNGPGDPAASENEIAVLREMLTEGVPYFGICLGNQLLGRALGFGTYKLPFGHRGINQPVLDKQTGRVEITAQNHGFAVDVPIEGEVDAPAGFGRVRVSHYSLNDRVVEGLECLDIPAFSVQFHPEAAAGPHDAFYLFDRFAAAVRQNRRSRTEGTSSPTATSNDHAAGVKEN